MCGCAFANVLPAPFRKRQTRPMGRRHEASLLTKTIMRPIREQRRLVSFFGSSSCAGFTVVIVHTHITHYFFSMKRRSPPQKRNEVRGANETQRRLVSLFTPPPSLSYFLYTFSPHFCHFSLDLRTSQALQRWTRKGSNETQRLVSLLCSFTPPPSLSCFLYTFSPHFRRFSLDLRMSQALQRWTRNT